MTILRPFNTYGPRQSARAVIPTVIGQIAAGKRTLKLGALHPTRDFTFVRDTANGFVQAMNCEQTIGRVVNIGSGFEISIGDTAKAIAEAMAVDVEIQLQEERLRPEASEVQRLFAGTALADELFDWRPTYAGLDGFVRGLSETADWFRNPKNLARYKVDQYNF